METEHSEGRLLNSELTSFFSGHKQVYVSLIFYPAPHMLFHASQHSCPTIGMIASHYVVMATSIAIWGWGGGSGNK